MSMSSGSGTSASSGHETIKTSNVGVSGASGNMEMSTGILHQATVEQFK